MGILCYEVSEIYYISRYDLRQDTFMMRNDIEDLNKRVMELEA